MQKYVYLVDLVKSFPTSVGSICKRVFTCKIGVDTAVNEPLKLTDSAVGENTESVFSRLLKADLVLDYNQ